MLHSSLDDLVMIFQRCILSFGAGILFQFLKCQGREASLSHSSVWQSSWRWPSSSPLRGQPGKRTHGELGQFSLWWRFRFLGIKISKFLFLWRTMTFSPSPGGAFTWLGCTSQVGGWAHNAIWYYLTPFLLLHLSLMVGMNKPSNWVKAVDPSQILIQLSTFSGQSSASPWDRLNVSALTQSALPFFSSK